MKRKEGNRMKLYHASDREIPLPDLRRGRKNADFGQGFYLSPDRDFICRWAGPQAVVNAYELNEAGLTIRRFTRSAEWFDYIFHNRRAQDTLQTDLVIGPIANDTIFDTLGILSSGFLQPQDALRLLLIGPEYTQVAVKTERALSQLTWLGAERASSMNRGQREKEQEAYQMALAQTMEKLSRDEP